jgi:hypothetical protein
MLARLATALGLVALCAISIVRVAQPPTVVPASAPDTVFSAERAMRHVEEIATRPHPMGTDDHDRVRDYIGAQLTQLGVKPQMQVTTGIGTRYQVAGRVQNILAWLPGTDPKGKAVLLAAHYDGVPAAPAAADDGAGAAALLETIRALRAQKQPLAHDVIVLFTDGEENGLLGAAAFVREHPWAKDVAVVLNFEARGTSGRSYMFETGPGNLDIVRALKSAGSVTAGSTFTTIYHALPNDTDLSEFSVLDTPAMNFAFADGVERYHTSHDDVAHLDARSVQHHGAQMLGLTRTLARQALPRPVTGDAVFFDFPGLGLVVYPVGAAIPLAILSLILTAIVVFRFPKGVIIGIATTIVAVVVGAVVAYVAGTAFAAIQSSLPSGGAATWSGWYAASIVVLVLAVVLACAFATTRWARPLGLHAGALVVWTLIGLLVAIKAPGVSYLFVWPALLVAVALILARFELQVMWVAALVTLFLLSGLLYGATVVMLGVVGVGGVALGALVALIALLLLPLEIKAFPALRWGEPLELVGLAALFAVIAMFRVHYSPDHPVRTQLIYAESADSTDAWLGTPYRVSDRWTRDVVNASRSIPAWVRQLPGDVRLASGRQVARVPLDAPEAIYIRDTLLNGSRRVVMRIKAPKGVMAVTMRASGAPVRTASIDERVVDTTRYRYRTNAWTMEYWAVPDTGAIVALSIPPGAKIAFEIASRRPGLPAIPGVTIPAMPSYVVPSGDGFLSIAYRKYTF